MRRSVLVMLIAAIPTAGCVPAVATGLAVAGGASLYGAKLAHEDCRDPHGSAAARACFWTDAMFTVPLAALGVTLLASALGVGVYAAAHDH